MNLVKQIDKLVSLVESKSQQDLTDEDTREVHDLSTEIAVHCSRLGLNDFLDQLEATTRHGKGPLHVPIDTRALNAPPHFCLLEKWMPAIHNLQKAVEVAAVPTLAPDDLGKAKFKTGIADFAEKRWGQTADEKSIAKWINNGALRAEQRGDLWEFSISDLKVLVLKQAIIFAF